MCTERGYPDTEGGRCARRGEPSLRKCRERQAERVRYQAYGHRPRASWHTGNGICCDHHDAVGRVSKNLQRFDGTVRVRYRNSTIYTSLIRLSSVKTLLTLFIVAIEATKEGVKFACQGDIGNGSVTLRSHTNLDKPEQNVEIELTEPVALTFSLKYLVNFCKASGLSSTVKLCLSNEVPLLVQYELSSNSYLRFYLAPKVKLSPRLRNIKR